MPKPTVLAAGESGSVFHQRRMPDEAAGDAPVEPKAADSEPEQKEADPDPEPEQKEAEKEEEEPQKEASAVKGNEQKTDSEDKAGASTESKPSDAVNKPA